jgi:hypothetical protein
MKYCKPLAYHDDQAVRKTSSTVAWSEKVLRIMVEWGDNGKRIMLTNWRLIHCFAEACKEKLE